MSDMVEDACPSSSSSSSSYTLPKENKELFNSMIVEDVFDPFCALPSLYPRRIIPFLLLCCVLHMFSMTSELIPAKVV